MKGINGNPALDAYQRVAVTPVNPARAADKVDVGQQPQAGNEQAAKVSISTTAKELAAGLDEGQSADKVAQLKAQVEQGSFQVNAAEIAGQMVDALG